jgi:hypothetical protein
VTNYRSLLKPPPMPPEELSPRIVLRSAPHESTLDEVRGAVAERVIDWRGLVAAVWGLSDDEQYTGELPAGLSSQQFWAKATRAAGSMKGKVGVAVRGRRWWCWTITRGVAEGNRNLLWQRAFRMLRETGEWIADWELSARELASMRQSRFRKGMAFTVARGRGTTQVRRQMKIRDAGSRAEK